MSTEPTPPRSRPTRARRQQTPSSTTAIGTAPVVRESAAQRTTVEIPAVAVAQAVAVGQAHHPVTHPASVPAGEARTESIFPEGFLPSLDPASVPASAGGPPMIIPPPLVPAVPPPDADSVIDGDAVVLAPPPTRMYAKRRRAAVLVFLALAMIVLVVGQVMRNDDPAENAVDVTPVASMLPPAAAPAPATGKAEPTASATSARDAVPADAADRAPTKAPVAAATGGFAFAGGYGEVLGSTGTLRRYKVAVEKKLKQDDDDFADEVDRILGDQRSWIAGRQFRLQRVPDSAASEFTIYLASADTSEEMCSAGGLRTDGYSSCRLPGQVIMNFDRWEDAVSDYGAPLEVYRAYAVNHEVGHQLGHGHEGCAGEGEPAPVMMQQTYGLKGCVANSWPYLSGKRFAGNPID